MPRRLIHRHAPHMPWPDWLKAGVGAGSAFAVVALLGDVTSASMIMAPMGAAAVLIYGMPESPVSQPAHVVGGNMIAAVLALIVDQTLPHEAWVIAVTMMAVIALLGVLRLTHPPAGATALVVLLTHPTWWFLLTPVLSGTVTLVLVAMVVHRIPRRRVYPLPVHPKT